MRCSKVTYQSKEAALAEIKLQKTQRIFRSKKSKERGSKANIKTYPYFCTNCNRWHLTTKNKKLMNKQLKTKLRKAEHE